MELIQYVRETRGPRKGQLRGVVVASGDEGRFKIGWSFTRTSPSIKNDRVIPGDRFNKEKGLAIARSRIDTSTNASVPQAVRPVLDKMLDRCKKYFKA